MMLVMMVEMMTVMSAVMSDGGDGNWKQVFFDKVLYRLCLLSLLKRCYEVILRHCTFQDKTAD